MTITIAWERRLKGYSEVVFCSDSRLNGGGNIDVCQKIFPLPREDAAIGFCGSTPIAYPLINQFISYIKNYKKNTDRALDASELPKRFCELTSTFLESYMDLADLINELRETSFIIGYFSWRLKRPMIYRISFDNGEKKYVAISGRFPRSISKSLHRAGQFVMIGDLRHFYFSELGKIIDYDASTQFDLEPFTALSNMLVNPSYIDRKKENRGAVGGAPQLLKIYPFLRTIEFAIYWSGSGNRKLYINGRETFEYEIIQVPHFDVGTGDFFYPMSSMEKRLPDDAAMTIL